MILRSALRRLARCEAPLRGSRRHLSDQQSPAEEHARRIIFSGIQPTGVPHLGNYLGALKTWVELQNTSQHGDIQYYCVVDLHAVTVKQDRAALSEWRTETFASLLAVGLDPTKSNIFFQSRVAQHSELMWLLSTTASTGYLSRMTQWKSKLDLPENASMGDEVSKKKLKLGLFSYPVLQAADILLYNTTHVPIGADQVQHLEFSRSLARGFNSVYEAPLFREPDPIVSPAKRIMSLTDPTQKMSKSAANPNSRILVTDAPDVIRAKLKDAITDSQDGISYDVATRPGISNLLDILKYTSQSTLDSADIGRELKDTSKKAFKDLVAGSVITCLSDVRERYESIMADPASIHAAAEEGAQQARRVAGRKMREVHHAMGLD